MNNQPGHKNDDDKDCWHLLPINALRQVVRVLMFGAAKYERNNWQRVEHADERYFSACMRHLQAWQAGERCDDESGLSHIAHACCCLIFMLWFENLNKEK